MQRNKALNFGDSIFLSQVVILMYRAVKGSRMPW